MDNRIYLRELKKISSASVGVITLVGRAFFSPLSPERIGQFNARERATYGTSLRCGDIFLASSIFSLNSLNGTSPISDLRKENTFMNSSLAKCVDLSILSIRLPISKKRNSGDTNSNVGKSLFNSKIINELPTFIREEKATFASVTIIILFYSSLRSFFVIARLTSSASSSACASVIFDLDTIVSISLNSSNFNLINRENNNCHAVLGILLNSLLTSSGIDIVISVIIINGYFSYLNISNYIFLDTNNDIISCFGYSSCIFECCFDFKNLLDHNSCAFESRLSITDLAFNYDIIIGFYYYGCKMKDNPFELFERRTV